MAKHLWVTIFLTAWLVGVNGGVASGYEYSWLEYNGHYYALNSGEAYWADAEKEAVAAGGHLVTINDAAEDAWLSTAFHTDAYTSYWIGLYQPQGATDADAAWTWVSGENSMYSNWYPGEPNGDIGENYAAKFFNLTLAGLSGVTDKWFDANDGLWNFRGIMERTSPVPLPPALLLFASGLGAILLHRGRTPLNRRH